MDGFLPTEIGPRVPRLKRRGVLGPLARALLRLSRWRVTGLLPNLPKLIVLAAPHSSLWDGISGIGAAIALGVKAHWLGKHSLFRGPWRRLLLAAGGIPVDRRRAHGAVAQVVREFREREALWLAIAPEGTRKPVARWKTGFWHIARAAEVPLLLVAFHYPERRIVVGPLYYVGDDLEEDLCRIQRFYEPWRGRAGKSALPLPG